MLKIIEFLKCTIAVGFLAILTSCESKTAPEALPENLNLQIQIADYNGLNKKDSIIQTLTETHSEIQFGKTQWEVNAEVEKEENDVLDIQLKVSLKTGTLENAVIMAELPFKDWSVDNYVLMPASVYNGNRFHIKPQKKYPPNFCDTTIQGKNIPITTNDVLHLNEAEGASIVELTTGDLATPAIGFQSPNTDKGFFLLTEQKNRLGNLGLSVEESMDRNNAIIRLSTPYLRQKRATLMGRVPSTDKGASWKAGDAITLHFKLYAFKALEIQDLYDKYAKIRQDVLPAGAPKQFIPFSYASDKIIDIWNQNNWNEKRGYYSLRAQSKPPREAWELGWTGSCMVQYAIYQKNNQLNKKRSLQSIDWLLQKTQSPSGFFYGSFDGTDHFMSDLRKICCDDTTSMQLIRRSADVTFFVLKHFDLFKKEGNSSLIKPEWETSIKNQIKAWEAVWEKNNQLGQFVDIETYEVIVGGSTSGALIPACLVLAADYYNNDAYLQLAKKIAKQYYENDVKKGLTVGGPGDAMQAPDSESAFYLLESFTMLYEQTQDPYWLECAGDLVRQCQTWVVSYDYEFPKNSTFDSLKINTTGAVFANVQNKHAAPGICTSSGDFLLKLYRATGDEIYINLLKDITHALPQYMSTKERPIYSRKLNEAEVKLPEGYINERVQMSDWETPNIPVGEVLPMGHWPSASLMFTYAEVPGIYIQPDKKLIQVLDHVNAEILEVEKNRVKLKIHNPTEYPAAVKTLVETSEAVKIPLGVNALMNVQLIEISAGETKEVWLRY
ncbi:hypothetical protein CLV33_101434 [Jejuia pallidilutea]|uniref:Uncharacterized protein n=1 Tax=Jejuia pallidilutea TaxID=504487 RepID=A0A362XE37_9FLAO|nr:hypothetical protein [Jejuia pallidilutea]PQV51510.1 hypothetical protein CLV33_101434 [Jejuia pallidilutea]